MTAFRWRVPVARKAPRWEGGTVFLVLSSIATIVLVVARTGASTPWFLSVLRTLGLGSV